MLIQASILTSVLSLLPSLVNAVAQVPVYSTLEEPFVVSVQDDFRVVLQYSEKYHDYEPVLSRAKTGLPAFRLTAGNLTTTGGLVEEGYTAFSPVNKAPYLSPVWLSEGPPRDVTTPFVAVTQKTGILRLWSVNGALVVRKLEEGEQVRLKTFDATGTLPPSLVHRCGTRRIKLTGPSEDAITLKLEIHHTYHKFGFIDTHDENSYRGQKYMLVPRVLFWF